MPVTHLDIWDHAENLITRAQVECSRMAAEGRLDEFEAKWHDPIAHVQRLSGFPQAKPVARRVAARSIRAEVKNIIEYYRWAQNLLADSPVT